MEADVPLGNVTVTLTSVSAVGRTVDAEGMDLAQSQ